MKNESNALIQNLKYPPPLPASNFFKNSRNTTPLQGQSAAAENALED